MSWLEQIIEAIAVWIRRCIPAYDPSIWNDNNGIQFRNNCYNYACNIQTGTFAQPGRATGHLRPEPFTCQGVGPAAQSDGLRPVGNASGCGCRDCCHKVALVIAPDPDYSDFHWYRLDRDDRWSHKPGGTPATNLDNSGNPITDPRTANRGRYTVFCGFYCVCKDKVSIA